MSEFEEIKVPHKIVLGTSPREADLAVVSTSSDGTPGNLNQEVLKECGYTILSMPNASQLSKGYFLLIDSGRIPILFIVTVGNGNTNISLNENLYSGLVDAFNRLKPQRVWLPLLGTGYGGLKMDESFEVTTRVLNSLHPRFFDFTAFIISIPASNSGKELYARLVPEAQPTPEPITSSSVPKEIIELITNFKGNYYLAGSIWEREEQAPRFYEKGIWENGREDKYFERVTGVNTGDIIFIKSTFAYQGISYLKIKAAGKVIANPNDGILLQVDWKIKNVEIDIEELGKYRSTFARVMPHDVDLILERVGKELLTSLDFFNDPNYISSTAGTPAPAPTPEFIKNKLKKPSYSNDTALFGKDRLGFENDIRAFAALIALKELKPPLAIALFGKWGSGKSFFMHNLQKQIDFISKHQGFDEWIQQEEEAKVSEEPFCKGVVQITFNAWSYMDANLWASLVANVFEKLDEYIDEQSKGELAKKRAEEMISEKLSIVNAEKTLKLNEKKTLLIEKGEMISRIKDLEQKRAGLLENIANQTTEELYTEIKKEITLETTVTNELKKYGITDEKITRLSPADLLEEVKSWWRFLNNLRHFTSSQLFIFVLGALIILLTWINPQNIIGKFNLSSAKNIITFFSIAGPLFIKFWASFSTFLKIYEPVKNFKNRFNQRVETVKADSEKQVKAITAQINQKSNEIVNKSNELENLNENIKIIEYELEHFITKRAFFDFIKNKSQDEKYDKSLSIITTIRRDFETLSELFQDYNIPEEISAEEKLKAEKKQEENEEFRKLFKKPLDRIVLYVDDLDRCPEDRVIEVLEAVNLLMAFPLFVVVVGVDPRWVKNALIKKYTLQFTGMLNNTETLKQYGVEPIHVTDYLEKIFQIPFHLCEADETGVGDLLDTIFEGQVKEPELIKENVLENFGVNTISLATTDSTVINVDNNATVNSNDFSSGTVKKLVRFSPEDLKISEQELRDLKELAWLAGNNPRTLKRYANMYRLVRAHENLSYNQDTERKDFLIVMFIIGLSIGEFKQVAFSFSAACALDPLNDFSTLMNAQVIEKNKFFTEKLKTLPENLKLLQGQDFNKYLPFVKRFSFENGNN